MTKEHFCSVCGRQMFKKLRHNGKVLCNKHYKQYKKCGVVFDTNPRTLSDRNEIVVDGNVAYIYLYNNRCEKIAEAIIDADDVCKVRYTKWSLSTGGYVSSRPSKGASRHLSRRILSTDQFVDHINHNTLDNRKCNLRIVNKSQNKMNSDHKGVSKTPSGKFYSYIKINQKMINLGVYIDEEEALYARWYAENVLFGAYRYPKDEPFILDIRKTQIKEYVDGKVQRL